MAPPDTPAGRTRSGLGRVLLFAACAPLLMFLLLPSLIIVPMALTKGDLIQFPPIWISVHSFSDYLGDPAWVDSTLLSFKVSMLAVAIGGVAGAAAAIAMHGRRFHGRALLSGFIMSPIVVPAIVLALGDYLLLAPFRLIGNWVALAIVHAMHVTPYVFISVQTSLTVGFSTALLRSARSLGAGRLAVLRFVYWPTIRPGFWRGRCWVLQYPSTTSCFRSSCRAPPPLPCRCACSRPSNTTSPQRSPPARRSSSRWPFWASSFKASAGAGGRPYERSTGSTAHRAPPGRRRRLEVLRQRCFRRPRCQLRTGAGRVPDTAGAERLGQDDDFDVDRGLRDAEPRQDSRRRAEHRIPTTRAAQLRHRVPGLCAVPAHERARQRRISSAHEKVGLRERQRQATEMLEKVGLEALAARRPHELSGGQQQRVALARALVFAPDALLLDEPLAALDRKLREQLQIEIKEIQRRVGISVLLVTHDQDEAMMMSDRIAVMTEGKIVQIGTPSDVYLHPATPFVAGFLGETNLLPGTCRGFDGDNVVVRFRNGEVGRARIPRFGGRPAAGDPVLTSIRPERMRILRPDEAADSWIDGKIVSCAFLGRHARYVVHAEGQTVVVSTVDWSTTSAVPAGTPVRLGWRSEDAQCLVSE